MGVWWLCSVVSSQHCRGTMAVYAIYVRSDVLGRCGGQYTTTPTISAFSVTGACGVDQVHAQQLSAT